MLFNLNRHQFEYETEFDSEYTIDSIYSALCDKYEVYRLEADKNFEWIKRLKEIPTQENDLPAKGKIQVFYYAIKSGIQVD